MQNLPFGKRYRYSGKVQGVGFRPVVFRVAQGLGVQGRVFNDVSGAVVEPVSYTHLTLPTILQRGSRLGDLLGVLGGGE